MFGWRESDGKWETGSYGEQENWRCAASSLVVCRESFNERIEQSEK